MSALIVAIVFGEISPKIKISSVRIPVAIPAPTFPQRLMASDVARDDADRFTILLPIKIALSILPELSVMRSTHAALLSPSSASARMRIRFAVVRAVSAEEKKADKQSRITNTAIRNMELVSK